MNIQGNLEEVRRRLLSPGPICLIWFGLVAGFDFIAAPAPFSVAGLEREMALAVNRAGFETLNRTEWVLAGLTLVLALWTRPQRLAWIGLIAVWVAVLLQSVWLLPELSARTDAILAGEPLGSSGAHGLYGVFDVIKLVALLTVGLSSFRWVMRPG